jgi:hypothetical protein
MRVPIFTNYKGDGVNLGGDDDGDGDEGSSPNAKGVLVAMMVSTSPQWWSRSSMIFPLREKKGAFASTAALKKIRENFSVCFSSG